jgi:hypothetical protein
LASAAHANDYLVAAKWLGHTIALNDVKCDGFIRCEATATFRAFATTPDGLAFIRAAGIDHARIIVTAVWAVHDLSPVLDPVTGVTRVTCCYLVLLV